MNWSAKIRLGTVVSSLILILQFCPGRLLAQPNWTVDVNAFEHTMTITAHIVINHEYSADSLDLLAAFHDDTCRGVTAPVRVGDEWIHFLQVYGNETGLPLNLRAWHAGTDIVMNTLDSVVFNSGAALGTPDEPYAVNAQNGVTYLAALTDVVETDEDLGFEMNLLDNDVINPDLEVTMTILDGPLHGELNVIGPPGSIQYDPDPDFNGADSLRYRLANVYEADTATVRITVVAQNDLPMDFSIISPLGGTTIVITPTNLDSTLRFSWSESGDVDNQPLAYSLVPQLGDQLAFLETHDIVDSTSLLWTYAELLEAMGSYSLVSGSWTIVVSDGITTVAAVNGPAVLNIDTRPVSIVQDRAIPETFLVLPVYPNPFNGRLSIPLKVHAASRVDFQVYSLKGELLFTRQRTFSEPGQYMFHWEPSLEGIPLDSGVYLMKVSQNDQAYLFRITHIR